MDDKLTHFNKDGLATMVDVSHKETTLRYALASGKIYMSETTLEKVYNNELKKGNVLAVAQVAGIMALKQTSNLIPMCHNINILKADLNFIRKNNYIECYCEARCYGETGIEMEVLTGVSMALLTIYDMCKAVDKEMMISEIRLEEKKGGKSGHYKRIPTI
ncbi:cyclic pyranopterin monophosphate synthase MoaC [Erysipelotrichaceae bacterium OttesenSCG-928-M19]|nr:cyclic pyranopterin monophosphate synthase MoaC [Erysipelotrichaceae bacterium OttesenSCG-928-M19]